MLLLKIYVAEQREIMQTSSCVPPHTHTHTHTHTQSPPHHPIGKYYNVSPCCEWIDVVALHK